MDVGERIKEARKNAGLTQIQLSEKSGVAAISIHQYEAGKRQPQIERLIRIAAALNVPIEQLIDMEKASEYTQLVVDLSKARPNSSDLPPSEFNEFERFIETLGYYTRLDGDNFRLHKGKASVVITPAELKALVRASKATVAALVQNLMETATPPTDAQESGQEGE